MATYPSKPWTNGQQAQLVPGETYEYDAANAVWEHLTKATLDADYQADKTIIEGDITTNSSDISILQGDVTTAQGDITTLQSDVTTAQGDIVTLQSDVIINQTDIITLQGQVSALDAMSDSETLRIQENISSINNAFALLDSDSLQLQALRTDLDAEIAATNADIIAVQARLDSDTAKLQALQTQVDSLDLDGSVLEADHDSDIGALSIPIVGATQPAGKAGQLWVNTNDGKLYYWDTTVEVFTEIVAGA